MIGTHTYTVLGQYTVSVTVEDDDGGSTTVILTVTVANTAFAMFVPMLSK